MIIEINNLTIGRIDRNFLKKIAGKVLSGKKKKIELSIALVGEGRIKELNKKYRRKNRPTDVLSFSYGSSGEIVICPKVIKENAKKYNSAFKKELARVLIHGILHLLGYSHKTMAKKQNHYLPSPARGRMKVKMKGGTKRQTSSTKNYG